MKQNRFLSFFRNTMINSKWRIIVKCVIWDSSFYLVIFKTRTKEFFFKINKRESIVKLVYRFSYGKLKIHLLHLLKKIKIYTSWLRYRKYGRCKGPNLWHEELWNWKMNINSYCFLTTALQLQRNEHWMYRVTACQVYIW